MVVSSKFLDDRIKAGQAERTNYAFLRERFVCFDLMVVGNSKQGSSRLSITLI